MRIAFIEDNEPLAKGMAYQLRDAGHAVDLICDGATADAFLSQEGADLIVLDINLPEMDGLTVLQRIRARGDATPVILLTAKISHYSWCANMTRSVHRFGDCRSDASWIADNVWPKIRRYPNEMPKAWWL